MGYKRLLEYSIWKVHILSVLQRCSGQTVLTANLNIAGIKGTVTLIQQPGVNSNTNVLFNLEGVTSGNTWEIAQFWVDLTVQNKCDPSNIGTRVGTTGGTLASGTTTATIASADLGDLKALMGHSIVIRINQSTVSCGTLVLQGATYTTAHVQMQDTISGDIWFRQAVLGERTEIYSDLFNSVAVPSTPIWKIYSGSAPNCKTLTSTSIYNPTSQSTCSNHANCAIGDLSAKIGNVSVGRTKGSQMSLTQDLNLPLSGTNAVTGKLLVILDGSGQVQSCGEIKDVKSREAIAFFSKDGVYLSVTFVQISPFDVTTMTTNLFNLRRRASGFHVHEYPVPQQVGTDDELCSPDAVGGHWNPFKAAFPSAGSTHDQYEIGDLSGKFGSLSGKDLYNIYRKDYNLPMFGPYSIVGRSLVIHKDLTRAPRWVCANIFDTAATVVAIATFTYPVIGHMIFSQSLSNPMSETWIYGELNYCNGQTTTSVGHIWMVHSNKVGDDAIAATGRCASAGKMFNPFGVDMSPSGDRKTECKITNPLRCPVGSGSMQTDTISIRKSASSPSKFLLTTRNLPLSGPGSIINRALMIHDDDNPKIRLACATIYHLRTRDAILDSWSGDVTGWIKMSQKYSLIENPTRVSIDLKGLNQIAGGYHVHEFPVPTGSPSPCSGSSVSGHLNPFNVDSKSSPSPGTGTHDKYEVGDLSGKYGFLNTASALDLNKTDYNLDLFGIHSIVGRSVVIHKKADNSRWTCGTIREDITLTAGQIIHAKATFSGSDYEFAGEVVLTQYVYPDGSMSDTSVFVNLNYTDKTSTNGHTLRSGTLPAWGDRMSATRRCESTGNVFNPFSVSTETSYSECGPRNPLRCMMGDVSGKQLGSISIDGKKMFSTDINLPLFGRYSVIGRSLVVGAANGGSERLACANIMPMEYEEASIVVDKPLGSSLQDIAAVYADGLNTDKWTVAVFGNDKEQYGCMSLDVFLMGSNAANLKRAFLTMVNNDEAGLGSFKNVICAADNTHASLVSVIVVLVCRLVTM